MQKNAENGRYQAAIFVIRGFLILAATAALTACGGTGLTTVEDENQAGQQVARQVADQIGLYSDSYLRNYVDAVGRRLVAELGDTPYQFTFQIVDQPEPNAFATPGGYIYLSRGILALVNNEDELAGILAHEISHVTQRHHARQAQRSVLPGLLTLPGQVVGAVVSEDIGERINAPITQAGKVYLASFSRTQETEADTIGMQLAARAGYDPNALGSSLDNLERTVTVLAGEQRRATFFDTHPTTPDRVANIEKQGRSLQWSPVTPFAADQAAFFKRIDGLYWGPDNPLQGVFQDQKFLQPDMGFTVTFPDGWQTVNTPNFVGAFEPNQQALMVLGGAGQLAPPEAYARAFADEVERETGIVPDEIAPAELGEWPAHFVRIRDTSGEAPASIYYVWIRSDRTMFQIIAAGLDSYTETMRQAALSLRNMTQEERESIMAYRVRIATAEAGESIADLSGRTGNLWNEPLTEATNGRTSGAALEDGELIKILRAERYE
ncbi:MAG: M48 family metalloprotease [Gammaproteobacteria bacterium]|nr:M48 family metalloprotease [Gammaproteobacteria bacterium]